MDDELYTISQDQKLRFAGLYLLEYMVKNKTTFPLLLRGSEGDLEPVLEWLLVKQWVEIANNDHYKVTDAGRKALEGFAKIYREYLRNYDVYSAVDLGTGEFALASYFDFDSDAEWRDFLNNDRWEDLRVAVADYKDADPVEIVFMSFLNEGRFGRDESGWQFDLLLGTVWDEILEICNEALDEYDLAYTGDDGREVSGESVLEDVITQGAQVLLELHAREQKEGRHAHVYAEPEANAWGSPNGHYDDDDLDAPRGSGRIYDVPPEEFPRDWGSRWDRK